MEPNLDKAKVRLSSPAERASHIIESMPTQQRDLVVQMANKRGDDLGVLINKIEFFLEENSENERFEELLRVIGERGYSEEVAAEILPEKIEEFLKLIE